MLSWPDNNLLKLGAPHISDKTTVTMLGYKGRLYIPPNEMKYMASSVTIYAEPQFYG